MGLLRAYRGECDEYVAALDAEISASGRMFSSAPDHSTWLTPSSVSQRYAQMCVRLGWDMNIHELRHYSATELISAGVDVRTVAGRLGHGGGGTTTLRTYAAWVAEADQRAAGHWTRTCQRSTRTSVRLVHSWRSPTSQPIRYGPRGSTARRPGRVDQVHKRDTKTVTATKTTISTTAASRLRRHRDVRASPGLLGPT